VSTSSAIAGLRRRALPGLTVSLCTLVGASAHADAPLEYLTSHGIRAHPIQALTWAMMIVSIAVIVIISALLVASVMRGWRRQAVIIPDATVVERPIGGMSWIYIGVGISTIVLFVMMVWTVVTLAKVSNLPSGQAAVTIEVTGHQWWWEVNYLSDEASRQFSTANEIYIPVGVPVEVRLRGADVIHSFWVPALTGKTDAIPGQNNRTWLQADHAGVFRGQCTEYCGEQHAHMGFEVIAVPPERFVAWWSAQLKGAEPVPSLPPTDGQNAFIAKCGICHTVRGTRAGGRLGPDLTHIMSRRTIGAATLPNAPGQLAGWIADPQHIKPGNFMPQLDLSGPDLISIRRYVETLK
jgi:cytochrome c oxidase subunit 2